MDRVELSTKLDLEIEALREQLVEDTCRILRFKTVSGGESEAEKTEFREQIAACAAFLKELSGSMGFRWIEKPGRWYCIEWAPDHHKPAAVIAIPTHIDVVPVSGNWTHPPFGGEVADGIIWGRGTQDDKGPLIATLYGMHALKRIGFQPEVAIRILIGTQEETGDWTDIEEYLAEEGAPDYGFTPDANFPIIIGEKGMVNLEVKSSWAPAAADAQPIEFVSLSGGTRPNVVPDLCELAIRYPRAEREAVVKELFAFTTTFTVENPPASITLLPDKARDVGEGREELLLSFLGKSAHGSTPEKGHNAVLDAMKFVAETAAFPPAVRACCRFLHMACSDTFGANLNLESTHAFVGPTTVSLGVARLRADGASAKINVRPTLGLDRHDVIRRAGEVAAAFGEKAGIRIEVGHETRILNALYLDPESAGGFLRGLQEGFQAVTGEEPELLSIGGTTYAKGMPNCCAFGPVLESAGEDELAHQTDEHIPVKAQARNAKIYGLGLGYAALNLVEEAKP